MNSINFEFYIKENVNLNGILSNWLSLLKYMKPRTFCFSRPHKGETLQFKEEIILKLLKEDLTNYEKYLLEIKADQSEYIHIELAPYLKEIAKVSCRFNKENYEKYMKEILKTIDQTISCDEMMLGYGHPVIYNKYFERGYGHIQFGAYYMMWFGKWALNYIGEERINSIKENTIEVEETNKYLKAILSENPWEYNDNFIEKKQRIFMKKLKFAEVVAQYNKKHEFNYIEFEEEEIFDED